MQLKVSANVVRDFWEAFEAAHVAHSLSSAVAPPHLGEAGYVSATGGPTWLALLVTASALAPPAFLLLGAALARAGERRRPR